MDNLRASPLFAKAALVSDAYIAACVLSSPFVPLRDAVVTAAAASAILCNAFLRDIVILGGAPGFDLHCSPLLMLLFSLLIGINETNAMSHQFCRMRNPAVVRLHVALLLRLLVPSFANEFTLQDSSPVLEQMSPFPSH